MISWHKVTSLVCIGLRMDKLNKLHISFYNRINFKAYLWALLNFKETYKEKRMVWFSALSHIVIWSLRKMISRHKVTLLVCTGLRRDKKKNS